MDNTSKPSVFIFPTLATYKDIFREVLILWNDCPSWAQPVWLGNLLFYGSILMTLLYVYTTMIIFINSIRNRDFRNPFYRCILILAVGDIFTCFLSAKESLVQCVIGFDPAKSLAWEAIGAFCIDLIVGVNLVISLIRLRAIAWTSPRKSFWIDTILINWLLVLACTWAFAVGILKHMGLVKLIWYAGEPITYYCEFLTPFKQLHSPLQVLEVSLTLIFYLLAFKKLLQMPSTTSKCLANSRRRVLFMAVLIFISELLFLYSSYWIGYHMLHLGSAEFNANLSYIVRPLMTGITPLIYFSFSREIRESCFWFWYRRSSVTLIGVQAVGGWMRHEEEKE